TMAGAGLGLSGLGGIRFYREEVLRDLGVPPAALDAMNGEITYGADATTSALAAASVACPPLSSYADRLWAYWQCHLAPSRRPAELARAALAGRRVLVTGASSGIGEALAERLAELGAELVLVARRADKLAEVSERLERLGAVVHVLPADLSSPDSIDELIAGALAIGPIDILVNNAAHSIRRPLADSASRLHDFERLMQLNYFGAVRLTLGLLPSMRAQRSGHVVNILSAGTTLVPPRFGQYQASKAALNAFSDALAAEHLHEGITTTSVYMPLVRTPMMEATDAYASQPGVISATEAADLIVDGIVRRKRRVMDTETLRRTIWMYAAPAFMTRVLNVLYRLHPEQPGAFPELDPDRALLRRFMGSYRL
ncbi:MAG: SDR family NAD(P)-dependent oxidoreductase, partial [Myxococcales bacterium]|nr:SDR family NAD(P)-dependent oxidoreductase [Myxococcales bacterium]